MDRPEIQDDQSRAFNETVKKFPKSPTRPTGSHFWQQKRQFAVRAAVKWLNEH